jgi:Fur family transcriptional regulator, ferric uptake regulator
MLFEKFFPRFCFSPMKQFLIKDGTCLPCRRKCSASNLSSVCCGETVTISGVNGCRQSENRLRSMGLSIGDKITVLINSGSVLVAQGDNRIALGAGMVEKIKITAG